MPTQKIFKQRVRARMTKTGESYTAARRQLLRRAGDPGEPEAGEPTIIADPAAAPEPDGLASDVPADAGLSVSDESVRRATGRGHEEWFAILDAWGATERTHTEIAAWLGDVQGVPSWWRQSVTVDYERARGMRGRHEMRDGFSVTATKTIAVDAERALAAFTDVAIRDTWLPDAPLRQRSTRAALTARFDWSDPPSRVVVNVMPKEGGRALVAVAHERVPDAATASRLKGQWRAWLGGLKETIETR
ncbi:MAG TPA: hypothetical protein VHM48_13555 [Candidatus Limnocylindrales bacterium]|nr:hypothetical protein [Candidatus Limnocylindrales bacterium]